MNDYKLAFIVFYSLRSIIAQNPDSVHFLAMAGAILFVMIGIFTILVVIGATHLVRQKGISDGENS